MTITIITETEVSTTTLGAIAITAAEGGIGYWAQIDNRVRPYNADLWDGIEVDEDFVFYTIEYENPQSNNPPTLRTDITPRYLAEGVGMLLRNQDLIDTDALDEMDAAEADMVVQFGIFGEQVFG